MVRGCMLADGLKGGVFVHSNGRAELQQTRVVGSAMAGVHVKWGGACRMQSCTVRDGRQAGALVEGDVSLLHIIDSVVGGNRRHALLAMDGGTMVVVPTVGEGARSAGPADLRVLEETAPSAGGWREEAGVESGSGGREEEAGDGDEGGGGGGGEGGGGGGELNI